MTRIRSRSILLASLSALIGLGVALIAAEYLLRYQRAQILGSDHMDPGLIRYHAQMGWRTVPLWRGRHSHHDFDVTYGTDRYGFRVSPALDESRKRRIAWVGDSFTFGLGVDDGDTFVNRLNLLDRGAAHLNYGIPGFSTDQEWLLIQREVLGFRPDEIVLVVYLGNDLLDNLLDFPLQAVRAKPRFVLEQGRLKLLNRQVPPRLKGPGEARITARSMVLGQEQPEYGWLSRILLRTELARRLRLLPPAEGMEKVFPQRLQPALELFGKLLEAMTARVEKAGVELRVVLLPGSSLVERPESLSGRFQEYLRQRLLQSPPLRRLKVLDLKPVLARHASDGLYHPYDGHLNRRGHRLVAGALWEWLAEGANIGLPGQ